MPGKKRIWIYLNGKARKECDWRDFDSADVVEKEVESFYTERVISEKKGITSASELRKWVEGSEATRATVEIPTGWEPCYADHADEHWKEISGSYRLYELAPSVVAKRLDPSFKITHEAEKIWAKQDYDSAVAYARKEYEKAMSKFA